MYKHFFKRIFDFCISLIALLCISPLLLIITLWLHYANKGSGALFYQQRPGRDGKIFKVIKFKTMTDEKGPYGMPLPDDQRLTKVGRFVRSTSIDELPQLINVLKGDMALIGPRPLATVYLQLYTPEQARRHEVRPGITGWAQVNGRNNCKFSKKFEMDVWYVNHCSFATDIKILWMTVMNVINRKDIGEGASDMHEVDDLGWTPRVMELLKEKTMLSEIGSNFWIKPDEINLTSTLAAPTQFGCKGSDYVWMSTGRSATAFVLDTIESRNPDVKKVAVIPPFTCHTVIEPFLAKGYEVFTFHTGKDLMATATDLLEVVENKKAGVVLFHRFFGIDTISDIDSITPKLKDLGVVTIEDCTQNLYSTYQKSNADYFVGSIRKWCGVPDGGFGVCKEGLFENKPIQMDVKLQEAKKEASVQKYEYMFEDKGEKHVFLNRYREAEDILDTQDQYYAISDLSAGIQTHLDTKMLKNKRRENFKIIAEGLKEIEGIDVIFKQLKDDEVPLYCPILCDDRAKVQPLLVKNAIFAPVVWPKADSCPEVDSDTDYLYDHILCIPIDQRYDAEDMERVNNVLKY